MNLTELKKLVRDNEDAFSEMVNNESDETIGGVKFETVRCKRDNSEMEYVFKADGKLYRLIGSYCSWGGTTYDNGYDDFQRVKEVQITNTEYENL